MIILKGFKYRIYPTKDQENKLNQVCGNTRFLWNYLLNQNIEYYKETKKFKFAHEMIVSLPELKKEYEFLNLSFSQSLQMVCRQLDKALKESFKKSKGFPKFKKKGKRADSFSVPQKWRIEKGFVFIPKIGEVKWVKHRALEGKPRSLTISQDGENWYCSVLCEIKCEDKEYNSENIIGIDLGLKVFAVLSDGFVIDNPQYLRKLEERLKRLQKGLSKKVKGSNNRKKEIKKLQSLHRKIRNQRRDFLHKITCYMKNKYTGFVIEDLHVKGMVKNHKLAKSISDVSWGEFRRLLEYKSLWNGKYIIVIDRFEPSSKRCSRCGNIKEDLTLSDRTYECLKCELEIDRDLNASKNILQEGINILSKCTVGLTGNNACGDDVRLLVGKQSSMKQEKEYLAN